MEGGGKAWRQTAVSIPYSYALTDIFANATSNCVADTRAKAKPDVCAVAGADTANAIALICALACANVKPDCDSNTQPDVCANAITITLADMGTDSAPYAAPDAEPDPSADQVAHARPHAAADAAADTRSHAGAMSHGIHTKPVGSQVLR